MEIKLSYKADMTKYGITTSCDVYCLHVKVLNVDDSAREMITAISDQSWIKKLGPVQQVSYSAAAKRTIDKLVKNILKKIGNKVTKEFGEYLISYKAQNALHVEHTHFKVPLAELIKTRVSGNEGFDFHTESTIQHIIFGEAKYSAKNTRHKDAAKQVQSFVTDKKDEIELNVLEDFVSTQAITNALANKKGFALAFSLNEDVNNAFAAALSSKEMKELVVYQEVYVIAIEV